MSGELGLILSVTGHPGVGRKWRSLRSFCPGWMLGPDKLGGEEGKRELEVEQVKEMGRGQCPWGQWCHLVDGEDRARDSLR